MKKVAACALLACAASGAVVSSARAGPPALARLLKGPYLTALSASSIDVRFELDGSASAAVELRRAGSDASPPVVFEDTAGVMHVVHASGLEPATRYEYAVRAAGKALAGGAFTTAPGSDSGAPLRFLVYGDDRSDPTAHAAVVQALAAAPSDFLVNTGDIVEDGGSARDWQTFFDVESRLLRERPLFIAIGNHELFDDRAGANFARYFGFVDADRTLKPYGTARLSDVRFFFLNAMHDWTSGEERQWLLHELDRADDEPGVDWRIAVMHHGPWSSGPHGACAKLVEAGVPELLKGHGIDLVFSGHDHIYERGDGEGMKYVVTGGGGAPLYRTSIISSTRKCESTYHFVEVATSRDEIRLTARRVDGSILDDCGFRKGGSWDCDSPTIAAARPSMEKSAQTSAPRCGCGLPADPSGPFPEALFVVLYLFWRSAFRNRRSAGEGGGPPERGVTSG